MVVIEDRSRRYEEGDDFVDGRSSGDPWILGCVNWYEPHEINERQCEVLRTRSEVRDVDVESLDNEGNEGTVDFGMGRHDVHEEGEA